MAVDIKNDGDPNKNRCYLKYRTKEQALLAIREVNNTITLGNHLRPLECILLEEKKANLLGTNQNGNNNNRYNNNYGNNNYNNNNNGGGGGGHGNYNNYGNQNNYNNNQNQNQGNYGNQNAASSGNQQPTASVSANQPTFLQYETEDGRPYFYDPVTKKTQWERPENCTIQTGQYLAD